MKPFVLNGKASSKQFPQPSSSEEPLGYPMRGFRAREENCWLNHALVEAELQGKLLTCPNSGASQSTKPPSK